MKSGASAGPLSKVVSQRDHSPLKWSPGGTGLVPWRHHLARAHNARVRA